MEISPTNPNQVPRREGNSEKKQLKLYPLHFTVEDDGIFIHQEPEGEKEAGMFITTNK